MIRIQILGPTIDVSTSVSTIWRCERAKSLQFWGAESGAISGVEGWKKLRSWMGNDGRESSETSYGNRCGPGLSLEVLR